MEAIRPVIYKKKPRKSRGLKQEMILLFQAIFVFVPIIQLVLLIIQ